MSLLMFQAKRRVRDTQGIPAISPHRVKVCVKLMHCTTTSKPGEQAQKMLGEVAKKVATEAARASDGQGNTKSKAGPRRQKA